MYCNGEIIIRTLYESHVVNNQVEVDDILFRFNGNFPVITRLFFNRFVGQTTKEDFDTQSETETENESETDTDNESGDEFEDDSEYGSESGSESRSESGSKNSFQRRAREEAALELLEEMWKAAGFD